MNSRTFNSILGQCSKRSGLLDQTKLAALDDETKTAMALHIIRNRGPLIVNLLTPAIDREWLDSMGYLYTTRGKTFTFVHTCEHRIR